MIGVILASLIVLAFAFLCYKDYRGALIIFPALTPLYLWRFEVLHIPSTLLEIIFATLCVFGLLTIRKIKIISDRKFWLAIIGTVICSLIGLATAHFSIDALGIWKAFYLEPILAVILYVHLWKQEDNSKLFRALAAVVTLLSAAALLQWLTRFGIPPPWDFERRATGIFPYPNAHGLFIAPLISLLSIDAWQKKRFNFSAIAAIIGYLSLFATSTDGGLIGTPVALTITAFFTTKSKTIKSLLVAATVIAAMAVITISPLRTKLTLHDYSGEVRRTQWSETVALLKDHPIFGVGLNQYPKALKPYHRAIQYEIFQYPHNIFLNFWVELGLPGLILLIVLGSLFIKALIQKRISPLFAAALLTMLIHGLVDVPFFKNDLAMLSGVLIAISLISSKTSKSITQSAEIISEFIIKNSKEHRTIIALSGFGGSGKSTIAPLIAARLGNTTIIKLDDFISNKLNLRSADWNGFEWHRLIAEVLEPLRNGKNSLEYGRYDWNKNRVINHAKVTVEKYIIIEGVGLIQEKLKAYFDITIWLELPREIATERAKQRDKDEYGVNHDKTWDDIWTQNDREYFEKHQPAKHADLVVVSTEDR